MRFNLTIYNTGAPNFALSGSREGYENRTMSALVGCTTLSIQIYSRMAICRPSLKKSIGSEINLRNAKRR